MNKKNYKKESYKSRVEWLKNRGLGGSDAAAIIGKSKWLTKKQVIKRLLNPNDVEEKQNARMISGMLKEPHIRKMYMLNSENKVIEPPKRSCWQFRRKDYPLLTLTPDGFTIIDGKKYGLEIKDVGLYRHEQIENWESGILPDQYYIQMLHYMVVMEDLDGVVLYANLMYFNKNDIDNKWEYDYSVLRRYVIKREEVSEDVKYLETKEIEFINELNKIKQGE